MAQNWSLLLTFPLGVIIYFMLYFRISKWNWVHWWHTSAHKGPSINEADSVNRRGYHSINVQVYTQPILAISNITMILLSILIFLLFIFWFLMYRDSNVSNTSQQGALHYQHIIDLIELLCLCKIAQSLYLIAGQLAGCLLGDGGYPPTPSRTLLRLKIHLGYWSPDSNVYVD